MNILGSMLEDSLGMASFSKTKKKETLSKVLYNIKVNSMQDLGLVYPFFYHDFKGYPFHKIGLSR